MCWKHHRLVSRLVNQPKGTCKNCHLLIDTAGILQHAGIVENTERIEKGQVIGTTKRKIWLLAGVDRNENVSVELYGEQLVGAVPKYSCVVGLRGMMVICTTRMGGGKQSADTQSALLHSAFSYNMHVFRRKKSDEHSHEPFRCGTPGVA